MKVKDKQKYFSCKKMPFLQKWVKLIEKLLEDPAEKTKIMSIGTIDSISSLLRNEVPVPQSLWYLTEQSSKYSLLTVRFFFFNCFYCASDKVLITSFMMTKKL